MAKAERKEIKLSFSDLAKLFTHGRLTVGEYLLALPEFDLEDENSEDAVREISAHSDNLLTEEESDDSFEDEEEDLDEEIEEESDED